MKKLNRKGFTLIELLAIIVILAIIMVVTIPTVLGSLGDAKIKTFNASANSSAEWIEKQYSIASIGDTMAGTVANAFKTICGEKGATCTATQTLSLDDANTDADNIAFINASGIKASNYTEAQVTITDGRACVILTANTTSGDFSNLKDNSGNAVTEAKSSGC